MSAEKSVGRDLTVPDQTRGRSVFGVSATRVLAPPPTRRVVVPPAGSNSSSRSGQLIRRLVSIVSVVVIILSTSVSGAVLLLTSGYAPAPTARVVETVERQQLAGLPAADTTTTTTALPELISTAREDQVQSELSNPAGEPSSSARAPAAATTTTTAPPPTTATTVVATTVTTAVVYPGVDYGPGCPDARSMPCTPDPCAPGGVAYQERPGIWVCHPA